MHAATIKKNMCILSGGLGGRGVSICKLSCSCNAVLSHRNPAQCFAQHALITAPNQTLLSGSLFLFLQLEYGGGS